MGPFVANKNFIKHHQLVGVSHGLLLYVITSLLYDIKVDIVQPSQNLSTCVVLQNVIEAHLLAFLLVLRLQVAWSGMNEYAVDGYENLHTLIERRSFCIATSNQPFVHVCAIALPVLDILTADRAGGQRLQAVSPGN